MIDTFMKRKQITKDSTVKALVTPYFAKAKSNLVTMQILSDVGDHKEELAISQDHSNDEWIVVVAYYAMYMAATSLISKLGYKSKTHTGTAVILEELFVKKKFLDKSHLENFESVRMKKEELELLRDVRDRRETAQYSVTRRTTRDIAESTKRDARAFIDRVEEILDNWSD